MYGNIVVAVEPVGGGYDAVGVPDGDGFISRRGVWVVDLCKNFPYFLDNLSEFMGSDLIRDPHVPDGSIVRVGVLAGANSDTDIITFDVDVRVVCETGTGVVADDVRVAAAQDLLSSGVANRVDVSAAVQWAPGALHGADELVVEGDLLRRGSGRHIRDEAVEVRGLCRDGFLKLGELGDGPGIGVGA